MIDVIPLNLNPVPIRLEGIRCAHSNGDNHHNEYTVERDRGGIGYSMLVNEKNFSSSRNRMRIHRTSILITWSIFCKC